MTNPTSGPGLRRRVGRAPQPMTGHEPIGTDHQGQPRVVHHESGPAGGPAEPGDVQFDQRLVQGRPAELVDQSGPEHPQKGFAQIEQRQRPADIRKVDQHARSEGAVQPAQTLVHDNQGAVAVDRAAVFAQPPFDVRPEPTVQQRADRFAAAWRVEHVGVDAGLDHVVESGSPVEVAQGAAMRVGRPPSHVDRTLLAQVGIEPDAQQLVEHREVQPAVGGAGVHRTMGGDRGRPEHPDQPAEQTVVGDRAPGVGQERRQQIGRLVR